MIQQYTPLYLLKSTYVTSTSMDYIATSFINAKLGTNKDVLQ